MLTNRHLVAVIISAALLLGACMEIKETITFNRDGSGAIDATIVVHKEYVDLVVPDFRQHLEKDMAGIQIQSETDPKTGNHILSYRLPFDDIEDVKTGAKNYSLVREPDGVFQTRYLFEGKERKYDGFNFDAPIPIEVTVNLPGSVKDLNGQKVDGDTVRWQWVGEKKGGKLTATSVGFSGLNLDRLFGSQSRELRGEGKPHASRSDTNGKSLFYKTYRVYQEKTETWIQDTETEEKSPVTADLRMILGIAAGANGDDIYIGGSTLASSRQHILRYRLSTKATDKLDFGSDFSEWLLPQSSVAVVAKEVCSQPGMPPSQCSSNQNWNLQQNLFAGGAFLLDLASGEKFPFSEVETEASNPVIDGKPSTCVDYPFVSAAWDRDRRAVAFLRDCRSKTAGPSWMTPWHFDWRSGRLTKLADTYATNGPREKQLRPQWVDDQRVYLVGGTSNSPGSLLMFDLATKSTSEVFSRVAKAYTSPRRDKIAFLTFGADTGELHLLDPVTGRIDTRAFLAKGDSENTTLEWDRDSRFVYVYDWLGLPGKFDKKRLDYVADIGEVLGEPRVPTPEEQQQFLQSFEWKRSHTVRVPRLSWLRRGPTTTAVLAVGGLAALSATWMAFRALRRRRSRGYAPTPRTGRRVFCTKCGARLGADADFCEQCGRPAG